MAKDQIQRFIFEDYDVRGELVRLEEVSQQALFDRSYPEPIANLLAQLIPAACLLSASLKFEGSLIIQAQNMDPLVALMSECTNDFKFRAIAKWDTTDWESKCEKMQRSDKTPLEQLMTNGNLAITIAPKEGKRYQGIVPLEKSTVADCLEDYFLQSEQIPTQVYLGQHNNTLVGMLIQRLPEAKGDKLDFQHIATLANTVKAEELATLAPSTLLHRLFHQEAVRLFPAEPVKFSCSCSRERTNQALLTLTDEEFQELLEKEKSTHVTCEFCGKVYTFDKIDLQNLKIGQKAAMDPPAKPEDGTVH